MQALIDLTEVAYLLRIFCYLLYLMISRKDKSTEVTVCIVTAVEFFMIAVTPFLKSIDDVELARFCWYNTFALCDTFLLLLLFHSHRQLKTPYGFAAKNVYIAYTSLAFLQVFCYLGRTYTDSEFVMEVYSYAVPTIDLSVMFMLTGIMLKEMFSPQTNASKATNQTH